jgi:hypothetical protein
MCFNEIHIRMCMWENTEAKNNIFSLSLELVKSGGYGFLSLCDGPRLVICFKRSLVHTEFDVSALEYTHYHTLGYAVGTRKAHA